MTRRRAGIFTQARADYPRAREQYASILQGIEPERYRQRAPAVGVSSCVRANTRRPARSRGGDTTPTH